MSVCETCGREYRELFETRVGWLCAGCREIVEEEDELSRRHRVPDSTLDDPRHGQARFINRGY